MLPKAVREQAERAEALQLQLIGNTAPEATVETPPNLPVETPVAPAPVAPTPVPPVVVEQPPAEVVETPAPAPATPDPWELKYKVLNGKYTAEVPRLSAENRDLKATNDRLAAELQALKTAPATPAADPDALTPDSVRTQYGDDFADAVAAIAASSTDKLRKEMGSTVERVEAHTAQTVRQTFMRDLGAAVPNWQAIDANPGFTAYLDEFDALTGRVRREFFNEADASNDAARVASFFATFAKASKPIVHAAPAPVVEAPSVEHLIAPDSSRQSNAPPGKKLWTKGEVNKFYADARPASGAPNGRYTAAEYARISADIDAAIAEGRYRG